MIRDELWLFIKCDGKWRNVISQGRDHPAPLLSLSHDWWHIHQPTRARQRRGVRTHHVYLGSEDRGGLRAIHHSFNIRKKLKKHSTLKFFSNCFELIRMHQPHTWENWEEFFNNQFSPPTLLSSCLQWTEDKTFWHLEKLEKWPAQLVEWENLQLRQNWSD